jgi:hypothetical protein
MTANTCSPNTNYDTKISVFEGSCGGLVCVGGNDDDFGLPCTNFQSRLTWCSTAGATYYILVHGFSTAVGDFEISVDCGPLPADNDNLADAHCIDIDCGASFNEDFNNLCATADGPSPGAGTTGQAPSCNANNGWCSFETNVDNDLWWAFTAPCEEGTITIVADGFDTQLAVWASGGYVNSHGSLKQCSSPKSCKSSKSSKSSKSKKSSCKIKCKADAALLVEVAANDDGNTGGAIFSSALTLSIPGDLVPNQTYWIQVDGYAGSTGQGNLSVTHKPTSCDGCGAGGNLVDATNHCY